MKFKHPLTEAIFLRRYFRFLIEVSFNNKKRRMLYCPNLGPMERCNILGTRVFFSGPSRLSDGYLDVLELVEVNGGALVSIHPEHTYTLVREGVHQGVVTELQDFRFLHTAVTKQPGRGVELLLKENGEQCFLHIEQVISSDDRGEGYIPESIHTGVKVLLELMALKAAGHRVILLYCVQHAGIYCLKPADKIDPLYGKTLREAVSKGVEVLAYRVNINLTEMTLASRIPVLLSEDITYR